MNSSDKQERLKRQIALSEELQDGLLKHFQARLDDGTITAAETAVLAKILLNSGWRLDADQLPQPLRDKLMDSINPAKLAFDDLPFMTQ